MYQSSIGMERQLNKYAKLSVNWIDTRGAHLLNSRNINTPIDGSYPFGDASIRLLTESAGFSRVNQLVVNTNVNYKKLYVCSDTTRYSYAKDDNEGLPADPYNLQAEWGPSSWGDIRHKAAFGATIPLKWKFTLYPFLVANSGQPYNITTGLDPLNTGFPAARPALLSGVAAGSCTGANLQYAAGFGCFDLNPAAGAATIGHNFARGPSAVNVVLRVAKNLGVWRRGPQRAPATDRAVEGMEAEVVHRRGCLIRTQADATTLR